jgi:hypothetical protein
VWEPAAKGLLADSNCWQARALDAGCGAMAGCAGSIARRRPRAVWSPVPTDERLPGAARAFAEAEHLHGVNIVKDDLFASALPPASFDPVHARFQLAPPPT